jgi:uncharacterized Zn finger protein
MLEVGLSFSFINAMASSFADLLTPALLKKLADDRSYQRGEVYFRQGQVSSLTEYEGVLVAEVQGSEPYQVEFSADQGKLLYECDCPIGSDGIFCKHCAAVGLAWLNQPATQPKTDRSPGLSTTTLKDVQQYLEQQDQATLVRLILDRAMRDTDWREHLLMKTASARPQGLDLKTFQRALKTAISTRGYIEYGEVRSYAQGIEKVLDSIADLLEQGHASSVIDLCEFAIPLLEGAIESVDDSNGHVGSLLEEVQELHHRACKQAQPDPIALAERLFELEMGSGYDVFSGALNSYAEILGSQGTARYRQLAEAEWANVPALKPGQPSSYSSRRSQLSSIMEELARQTGDVEAIVAVKRRDLSRASAYLQIAQLYQDAGQRDRALQWAEDGLKAFVDRPDARLRDFVVEAYQQRGWFDRAMAIVWAEFTELSSLRTYQKLKTEAERSQQWDKWRQAAIAHIREQIKQAQQQKQGLLAYTYRDHSLLVEIFLWQGETDLAWQEAKTGGCSKQLWLKLADQRQQDRPEDALSIYMNEVEPLIQQTNNTAYAQAVEFVKKSRSLMLRLEMRSQFDQYLRHLRDTYKAKRNFIKLLNQEDL